LQQCLESSINLSVLEEIVIGKCQREGYIFCLRISLPVDTFLVDYRDKVVESVTVESKFVYKFWIYCY